MTNYFCAVEACQAISLIELTETYEVLSMKRQLTSRGLGTFDLESNQAQLIIANYANNAHRNVVPSIMIPFFDLSGSFRESASRNLMIHDS